MPLLKEINLRANCYKFVHLPPYAPEVPPAERVWLLRTDVRVETHFVDLDALAAAHVDHCRIVLDQPERVRAVTYFQWWPAVA